MCDGCVVDGSLRDFILYVPSLCMPFLLKLLPVAAAHGRRFIDGSLIVFILYVM